MAVTKRGKKWWIEFSYRGRRYRRSSEARTKTEARHELQAWKYAVRSGKAAQESNMTFRELGEKYLSDYAVTKRSYGRDVVIVRNLSGFFGDYRIGSITPQLIVRYRTRRSRQVTPSTTNRELSCLRKMLNLATDWGLLTTNPTRRVKPLLLVEDNVREHLLTEAEESRLIKECSPPYLQDMVLLASHTGMRVGEILSLTWRDVSFPFNRIVVEASNSKSKRVRHIPLNARARAILERVQSSSRSDYVFADKHGTPLQYVRVAKGFQRACHRAGIKGMRFHDLRHGFATKLASRNVPLRTIQKLLGHSTIIMTERYAHAQYEQEAVDLLVKNENMVRPTTLSTTVENLKMRSAAVSPLE